MAKYTSGRQKNLKVGISSYSENLTSLEVIGNVGIATTNATSKLYVVGDGYFTGVITAKTFDGAVTYATNAGVATYASFSGISTYSETAGIATYALSTGNVSYASTAGIATYATSAGVATYAITAGVATALQDSRTFEITGDILASPISFNGTGNVSLAATIQPNSVALGTDTFGDYVQSITGTTGQIVVTNGTGEGSTPVLSFSPNPTLGGNVTIGNDLQVNRNLNVTGNITVGGTTAYIIVQDFRITDADITLGFTTNISGNDISTDTTANHGGIAIASTQGSPLVQLVNVAIGESLPATYKKFMWFKSGSFAGLNTDAWLSNYAIGIGSTQFPSGTRLAAGSVQFTERDLAVVRNINSSGIITGTLANSLTLNTSGTGLSGSTTYNNSGIATFTVTSNATSSNTSNTIVARNASGNFSAGTITANLTGTASTASFATTAYNLTDAANIITGTINSARLSGTYNVSISGNAATASYATSAGIATYAGTAGIATYATSSGIATYAYTAGIATYSGTSGIATYANTADIATYASTSGVSTSVIGGIASVTSLNVSGISTLGTVKVSTGIISATSGVVTYYGDGSKLTGVTAFYIENQTFTSSPVYPTFASNTGVSTVGIATTGIIFVPSSGNLGIGSTNPTSKLYVVGDTYITGILTANRIISTIYGEFLGGSISGTNIVGTSLSITGISTLGTVQVSSGIVTATSGIVTYYGDGSKLTGVIASSSIGIQDDGIQVGTATTIDFGSNLTVSSVSSGIATVTATSNFGLMIAATYNMLMP
jgi:hypothetical protein